MPLTPSYLPDYLPESEAPSRASVDALPGLTLLEFGDPGCGHCRAADAAVDAVLRAHPDWRHVRVEDGAGRALGRSFRVKLWPTLVLLKEGQELARAVRPREVTDLELALKLA